MAKKETQSVSQSEATLQASSPDSVSEEITPSRASAKVLVFLEAEPSPAHRELLTKMMGAIGLSEADFVAEWGEFPTISTSFVLGLGLGQKKSGRLSALRPDWLSLPSLAEIQLEPNKKRSAWSTLQQFQAQMRMPR